MGSLASQVAEYITGCPGTSDVRPITMTIGDETFEGAEYVQRDEVRLYMVGEVPLVYRKAGRNRDHESKIVFTRDGGEWYIACGYTPYLCKPDKADFVNRFGGGDLRPHHPFGFSFLLMRWPTELLGPIDQHNDRPRIRKPFAVAAAG